MTIKVKRFMTHYTLQGFLGAKFSHGERHQRRLEKVGSLEAGKK